MFTYIRLKNFMSFGDITFDFRKNAKTAKNFIVLYGENGSGKSNFVKSIEFLCRSLSSLNDSQNFQALHSMVKNDMPEAIHEVFQYMRGFMDIAAIMKSCRTIDEEAASEVEYGFILDGHEGYYRVKFTTKILEEELFGFLNKKRGRIFYLSTNENQEINVSFWNELLLTSEAKKLFLEEIAKYWGNHTFLGILTQQIYELNPSYIQNAIAPQILRIQKMLQNTTTILKSTLPVPMIFRQVPVNILKDISKGTIDADMLPKLETTEKILNSFFSQTYADIKSVYYKKSSENENKIKYELFVEKMIAGKIRHISITQESAGTQNVLDVFRIILGSFFGITVVYDEIDNGIHDLLLKNIIDCALPYITGQLIITTHNTLLLESIDKHSAYLIDVDYEGNKEAVCFDEYKIQGTDNMRIKYLKGLFGGTPYADGVDYDEIISELKEAGEDEENDGMVD